MRAAVPAAVPVTAKMRLGVHDTQRTLACAQALAHGGATQLVVHARTRDEGYRPPAHWEWIARIRAAVDIPVVANGELGTSRLAVLPEISGCEDVMLGRGAVADPWPALRIKGQKAETPDAEDWHALLPHIHTYWIKVHERVLACHAPGRLKLLLADRARTWPQAASLQAAVRRITDPQQIPAILAAAHLMTD